MEESVEGKGGRVELMQRAERADTENVRALGHAGRARERQWTGPMGRVVAALHGHPAPPASASSAPHRRRVLKFDLLWGDITL